MVNFAVLVESTIATNKLVVELHMRRSDQLSASQKHSIKAVAWRASSVDEEQAGSRTDGGGCLGSGIDMRCGGSGRRGYN